MHLQRHATTATQKPSQSHVHARPGRALVLIDSAPDHPPQRRPIRSFVLRQGRLTEAQERAFAELWPRYGVEWPAGEALDLPALFGNDQPVYLEIGFGNGETLAEIAAMSALPASFGLMIAITLPIPAGPAAPVEATASAIIASISASDACAGR